MSICAQWLRCWGGACVTLGFGAVLIGLAGVHIWSAQALV